MLPFHLNLYNAQPMWKIFLKRLQEKVVSSKRVGQKMATFAIVMGREILGFAVFRFCFIVFFVNGFRLKLWSFV